MDQEHLIISIKRLLAVLSPFLDDWRDLFKEIQQGLVNCQPELIEPSLSKLSEFQQKFQNILKVRDQILRHARQAGYQARNLGDLLKQCTSDERSELLIKITESEKVIRELHRQLWSMWVIANRSQQSLSQVMEMFNQDIGQRGIYNTKSVHANHGGLLLDAAA